MFGGLRTLLIGYHNPLVHTYYVTKTWYQIYRTFPSCREFICIMLHDIGYILQSDANVSDNKDVHPLLGAQLCRLLFGPKYYSLCIGHSRAYSQKLQQPISKLCYADKYAVLLIPLQTHRLIYLFDSPQVTLEIIMNFRASCHEWWIKNGWCVT